MSWTASRAYFKTIIEARNFALHPDAFDVENIPSTVLDKSYHLTFGPVTGLGLENCALDSSFPVVVRLFFKGLPAQPNDAVDRSILFSETFTKDLLKPTNRLTGLLKNVNLESVSFDQLSASNDHSVIATLIFNCRVWLEL